jgi:regulator of sigma E protease
MNVIGIIAAIVFFFLLVIGHEFGHFASAKMLGVDVEEFSMGMGPQIFHKEKNGTEYSLRAFPIGGFCRLEGEDGESDSPTAFTNQPLVNKIPILAAGSLMNVILGLIMLVFVYTSIGATSNILAEVSPGGPAETAGIMAGDEIIAVNGTEMTGWTAIVTEIDASHESVDIRVDRDGEILDFDVPTMYNEEVGRYVIGITSKLIHSPAFALKSALAAVGEMFMSIIGLFGMLFKGQVKSTDVVGVVGIISIAGESARHGIINVINLMGLISINLAIVNMLPIPALDGGRILLAIIAKISGGRFTKKAESIINAIGLVLLLALMVFIVIKDVFQFIL